MILITLAAIVVGILISKYYFPSTKTKKYLGAIIIPLCLGILIWIIIATYQTNNASYISFTFWENMGRYTLPVMIPTLALIITLMISLKVVKRNDKNKETFNGSVNIHNASEEEKINAEMQLTPKKNITMEEVKIKNTQRNKYIILLCLSIIFLIYQCIVTILYSNTENKISLLIHTDNCSRYDYHVDYSFFEEWAIRDELYRADCSLKLARLNYEKAKQNSDIGFIHGLATANYRNYIPFNRLIVIIHKQRLIKSIKNNQNLSNAQQVLYESIAIRKYSDNLLFIVNDTVEYGLSLPKVSMIALALVLFIVFLLKVCDS